MRAYSSVTAAPPMHVAPVARRRTEGVIALRSFVRAGVLFIVLLAAHDIQADPIIVDGIITKTGDFSPAAIQFSATDNFSSVASSLRSRVRPSMFNRYLVPLFSWMDARLGGSASGSDVLGTVTIGAESFRASGGVATGSLHLVFDGSAVLPPVGGPVGLVWAPFSLTGQWAFPFVSGQEFRPGFSFSGSGTVSAFLAPSLIQSPPGWQLTRLEYVFGSDTAPNPGTCHLVADGDWTGRTGAAAVRAPIMAHREPLTGGPRWRP